MKTKIILGLFFILLSLPASAQRSGRSAGSGTNGGSHKASVMVTIIKNIVDELTAIGEETVKARTGVDLGELREAVYDQENPIRNLWLPKEEVLVDGKPRDARNYEEGGTHTIEYGDHIADFDPEGKIRVATHENLCVVEQEFGDDYSKTTEVIRLLKEKNVDLYRVAEMNQTAKDPALKTVLLWEPNMLPKDGMTFGDAEKICAKLQAKHGKDYATVYCVIPAMESLFTYTETRFRNEYRLIGYRVDQDDDSVLWGVYQGTDKKKEPVIRTVRIPYDHKVAVRSTVYGLRVYGMGKIDHDSPGLLLLSSANIGGQGIFKKEYPTEYKALLACRKAKLMYGNSDPRYEHAECFAPPKGKKFTFEVRTKDPFVAKKSGSRK